MSASKIFVRGVLLLVLSVGILAAPLVLTVGGTGAARAEEPAITASNAIHPPSGTSTPGNAAAGTLVSIHQAPVQAALPGDVVISELRPRGPNGDQDEFVELYNRSGSPVDISSWRLKRSGDCAADAFAFDPISPGASLFLNPGWHYLIGGAGYSGSMSADMTLDLGIAEAGGVGLFDAGDTLMDAVGFCGQTTFVESPALSAFTTSNVNASYDRISASGGSCADTDHNAADFVLRSPSDPQNFSSGLTICGNPTFTPSPTASLTATASGPTPTPASWPLRSVIINEVGWAGTVASTSDEWIELYHPGAGTVYLDGWRLVGVRAGAVFQFNISFADTATDTISIGPGGYLVLTPNRQIFSSNSVTPTWALTDANFGLLDTGMTLYLYDPGGGSPVDTANLGLGGSVSSWPAGSTSGRRSMERYRASSDTRNNWVTFFGATTASDWPRAIGGGAVNGSPGRENWAANVTITPPPTASPYKKPTGIPPTPFAHMVINEFLPRAGTDWNQDGKIDVYDEFIELKNLGPIDVDLKNWKLDVQGTAASTPFMLPSQKLKPGERAVFYGSTTTLRQEDSGGNVRLINPAGIVFDARGYGPVDNPDETHCRLPDGYYWTHPCFPTPGLENSLTGTVPAAPPVVLSGPPPCLLADSVPAPFREAECNPYGAEMWDETYWDKQAGQSQFRVRDFYNEATTIVQ